MRYRMVVFRKALWFFMGFIAVGLPNVSRGAQDSIHVAMPGEPATLNYFGATDASSRKVIRFFYMPLYVLGPEGGQMVPWLAESSPEVDSNAHTATVRLREAKWQDATPVTAEDLIFTVSVIQEFKVPGHFEKWRDVVKMESIDSRTIRFTLKGPAPGFFNRALFTPFVRKKAWIKAAAAARAASNPLEALLRMSPETICGNGPFVLQTFTKPLFMVLKKNPHFFGQNRTIGGVDIGPWLETIILEFNRDIETCLRQLSSGEIDFLWCDVPADFLKSLEKIPSVEIFETDRTGYDYLAFNLDRKPYGDILFRRAVALMIDRDQILRRIGKTGGQPVYSVIPPQNAFWSNPRLMDLEEGLQTEVRTEKALKVLQKAGYSWRDGHLLLPDGSLMKPMEILTTRGWQKPFRLKTALEIRKALARLGIPVTQKMKSLPQILAILKEGAFDACIMGWSHLSRDPDYLHTFFHSREAHSGGKNYARFRNRDFDRLSEQAAGQADPEKRKFLVFAMQMLIAEKAPWIPLYTFPRVEVAGTDHFKGWIRMPGGIGNLWSFIHLKPVSQAVAGGS